MNRDKSGPNSLRRGLKWLTRGAKKAVAAAAVTPRRAGGVGPSGIISLPQRDREGTCDETLRWRPRPEPAPRAHLPGREGHHGCHRTGRAWATGAAQRRL